MNRKQIIDALDSIHNAKRNPNNTDADILRMKDEEKSLWADLRNHDTIAKYSRPYSQNDAMLRRFAYGKNR